MTKSDYIPYDKFYNMVEYFAIMMQNCGDDYQDWIKAQKLANTISKIRGIYIAREKYYQ